MKYDKIITQAFQEDNIRQDITTNVLVSTSKTSEGYILFKENGIVCGVELAKQVFKKLDSKVNFSVLVKDGTYVKKNTKIAVIKGKTRTLLSAERTALNFLGYLSGIATLTHAFVKQVKPYKAQILDTRKTTPSLRYLEKYAVKCGGGVNHRIDLKEMVLIKDNHRAACYKDMTIKEIIAIFRKKTKVPVEIEVDNLEQFKQALSANPDFILLDNMTFAQMKKAVELNKNKPQRKKVLLEASGGITLKNVHKVAQAGVDRISIGALTHSHKAIDVSMEIII